MRRVTFVQETLFGKMWTFTADAERSDTAYSTQALGSHTDLTYMNTPAGSVHRFLPSTLELNSFLSVSSQRQDFSTIPPPPPHTHTYTHSGFLYILSLKMSERGKTRAIHNPLPSSYLYTCNLCLFFNHIEHHMTSSRHYFNVFCF